MMLVIALLVGLGVGALGYWFAPAETCPGVRQTLLAGSVGALPGVLVAFVTLEDLWWSIDPSSLSVSILGSTLAVMAVAFAGERQSRTRNTEAAKAE